MFMTSPESITLRPATEQDSELVYAIKKTAFRAYVEQTFGWDEAAQRAKHSENFNPATIHIISYKSADVGWIGVERANAFIYVDNIHILPEYQNLGIGTILLKRHLAEGAERNIPVTLRVLKVNNRARALYQRLGFSVTSEIETHFLMEARP
jgi:ribosomal protein S18 acetylase RimI-like enzyme